ncbi:MAG: hypothetical protein RLZZ244_181, partial [Verrucomicrobiota bacterium]
KSCPPTSKASPTEPVLLGPLPLSDSNRLLALPSIPLKTLAAEKPNITLILAHDSAA